MGQTESTIEDLQGHHVLRIQKNSPASQAGISPYFDFITAVNGTPLLREDSQLVDAAQLHDGKPMSLTLFNCKSRSTREVTVVPSSNWGGSGMLGLTIRFCAVEPTLEHVWHVLDVEPNSPASQAGLEPFTDYLIGTADLLFVSESDLELLVEKNIGRPIPFYVYSTKTESIRDVTLVPNDQWGGSGCLGCGVGYGLLHQVPLRTSQAQTTAEMLPEPSIMPTPTSQPHITTEPQPKLEEGSTATTEPVVPQATVPDPTPYVANPQTSVAPVSTITQPDIPVQPIQPLIKAPAPIMTPDPTPHTTQPIDPPVPLPEQPTPQPVPQPEVPDPQTPDEPEKL